MSAPVATANIASHLPVVAARQPHKRAVVVPSGRTKGGRVTWAHYTFAQLDEASDRYAWGLKEIGIGPGVRTVLMVKPSLEFFALTFALFKTGAVIVMIDPGIGTKALKKCLAEVQPEAFVGIPAAHVARLIFRSALRSVRINVTVGPRLFWGGHRLADLKRGGEHQPFPMEGSDPSAEAAILFTSGSTGIPKGAVYTHGIFDAQVRLIGELYRFGDDEIDLPTFPLFALFDPALGMTAVIPDMDARSPGKADPAKIVEAIEDHGCTTMFGSPALLRNLGRYGSEQGIKLRSLRRVLSAGAPVPRVVLEQMEGMMDGGQVFTPYGATECLPVASIGSREVLGETVAGTAQGKGICVGRTVDANTVRIITITDEPIATWSDELLAQPGQIGEITVRGPVVTASYYGRPVQTAAAKIDEGGRPVHRMGDLGWIDEGGRLWMCGRKSHRVQTRDGDLFTVPVERVFDQHADVLRTALVGLGEPGSQTPLLLIEVEPGRSVDPERLIAELRELGQGTERTRGIAEMRIHPGPFPVDIRHNAKIDRPALAAWAAK